MDKGMIELLEKISQSTSYIAVGGTLALLFLLAASPGCLNAGPPDTNLTESELADQYLAAAAAISDYRSEYIVRSGIARGEDPEETRIRYDYKSPSFARIVILGPDSRQRGTFATKWPEDEIEEVN